jgi:beta-glucosidase
MLMKFSRRTLGRLLSGSAAAVAFPGVERELRAQSQDAVRKNERAFPPGFLWGSATASYQVEGAVKEGGRGVSIWDTFSHRPGKVHNGDTGDVADDYYDRYRDDILLMKGLGLKTCRFSVAWPRIFPNGRGTPNQQGVDFYLRMTEALLEAGIEPYCTLYHWDLPQALQDKGGWENRETAQAFGEYAGYTAGKLAGHVKHFMTLNEMRTFVEAGYRDGVHAPGLHLPPGRLAQLTHYVVLGHGMAVQAVRASTPAGTKIGLADNPVATTPVIENATQIAAAHKAFREENAMYLTVLMEGRYTDLYLKRLGADAPKFTPEELRVISSPLDFVGLNIYQPAFVRADAAESGYAVVPAPASYPAMYSPWLTLGPEAIYWVPRIVSELWKVKEFYITENGASSADVVAADGHVYDTDRVMFLRNYMSQLQRVVNEGVPVKGYFLWSLLDNFEWADGYEKRFGIVYVDFATQRRIPKLSASFYADTIRCNAVC